MNSRSNPLLLLDPRVLCLAAALVLLGCSGPQPLPSLTGAMPRPAESEESEENQEAREEWIEGMHRTAPGVDWRALEDQNQRDAMVRRENTLISGAATAGQWNEVGSRNLAGSTFVTVPSTDGNDLYIGSAHGGVFTGPKDGSDWQAIGDGVYGGAHLLAIIPPTTPGQDIILRGVGSQFWRSADGGLTWQSPTGLVGVTSSRRLLKMNDSQQTLFAMLYSGGWKLYRSQDRGVSFQLMRSLAGQGDIWTSRDGLGDLFLFENNRLYRSSDLGASFTTHGNAIGVTPSDVRFGGHDVSNGTTFSVAAKSGGTWQLWRTVNSASSWTHPADMPEMWSAFNTSATDPDLLVYGGVELWVSHDGGNTFQAMNWWWEHPGDRHNKLHADMMGVDVVLDGATASGERWYINCHGGTYESVDQFTSVNWITSVGLGVSQYYSTLTSRRDPNGLQTGSQDQGYQSGILGTPGSGLGPWADLVEDITGDYGHLSSTDGSHNLVYSDYPGFVLVVAGEPNHSLYTVGFPTGFAGQWLPYMIADPEFAGTFYLCGKKIWKYDRAGTNTWNYSQLGTTTFTQAVTALAFSPIDPNYAWCTTSNGQIHYSTDRGVTWTQSSSSGPGAHYFYGTTIIASSRYLEEVWVAGAGYSNAPVVYSANRGLTFSDRANGLPPTLIYGMCEAPDRSGTMYAAGQSGAYEYDPATQTWSEILAGQAPLTTYWSVEAIPARNAIRFGTYGRGIWDYFPGTPGFFPYGELRDAPTHLPLTVDGPPDIGTSVQFRVTGMESHVNGFLSICTAGDDSPMFGGDALVDLNTEVLRIPFRSSVWGNANIDLTIPNNAALIGNEYFLQVAVPDSRQPMGWSMSNGLRAVVGP